MGLTLNGEPYQVPAGTTVAGLLRALGMEPGQAAVERNGAVLPRREHEVTVLQEGDVVEVVTFVGGG
ncbi:MAG: sulfur carrier protein ThiS [Myxococcota bacterium]|nr:sulfur carrier protein ThiS [Myxococcota bacterium]